jgi:glutamate dehydrogenase/leucine dehydrogenase
MAPFLESSPQVLADRLAATGDRRAWVATRTGDRIEASESLRQIGAGDELVSHLVGGPDHNGHRAIFLEVGQETGCLLGAFVHRTHRGQAQGGLRYWPYDSLAAYLGDGLRLAQGMGRKCALAGLWWGGGKGVIARRTDREDDPESRRAVFAEYGRFVSSLRGCYVTAEDAGTTPADIAEIQHHTRFVTCIPPERGGAGNPSEMTARGVVAAMETALAFDDRDDLRGAHVAMQGAGHVGGAMLPILLERGVARITVADTQPARCADVRARFGADDVVVREVAPGDASILTEPCDVLVPNALGGVLNPKTIPGIRADLICGAANNALDDDERDARALAERGIVYVPDFVANRMGIVFCANEHAGSLPRDPQILQHLDPGWPGSIQAVTRRVLEQAKRDGTTPVAAANAMADDRSLEPHPIWGDRASRIVDALVGGAWTS